MSCVQLLNKITEDIDRVGWSVVSVKSNVIQSNMVDTNGLSASSNSKPIPHFAYTIGLWQTCKHPEVIILGLPPSIAETLLDDIGAIVKAGNAMNQYPKLHHNLVENYPVAFFAIDNDLNDEVYSEFFGIGKQFYGDRIPILQMIYPDKFGSFPWQDGCSESVIAAQPALSQSIAQQAIDWDKAEGWGLE